MGGDRSGKDCNGTERHSFQERKVMKIDMAELDGGTLVRGRVISRDEIRRATGIRYGTDDYRLACLQLKLAVERVLKDDYGEVVSIACLKGELHILTHAQQAVYDARLARLGVRRIRRSHRKLRDGVDIAQLSQEEKMKHYKNLTATGEMVSYFNRRIRLKRGEPIDVQPTLGRGTPGGVPKQRERGKPAI